MKLFAALLVPFAALAWSAAPDEDRLVPSPNRLAAESDMVVVAQLERVDYDYRRGFPVGGRAWFKVLFAYKTPEPTERLIVHEEGLKDVECYFPDLPRSEEQPRYLLFLVRDENNRLRGHAEGCAMEMLVTADGRYALRWPQQSLALPEDATELVQEFEFHGPLARVDASDLTRTARQARAEQEYMRIEGTDLLYTRGILLQDFRPFMADGLAVEDRREQRRLREIREILDAGNDEPEEGK